MLNQEDRDAAFREYVNNVGMDRLDECWVWTVWDTWERNPHYEGPDQPHPEDDDARYPEDPEECALFNYADEYNETN